MNIWSAADWSLAWDDFQKQSSAKKNEPDAQAQRWNQRADSFARNNLGTEGNNRRQEILAFITEHCLLQPGMTVLDIGCGPGTFAIPFAETGLNVVALDPAAKMIEHLKNNIPSELSGGITCVTDTWENIDVKERGWECKFDLVFASMSPGINDLKTLEKMLACSRRWCYLSSFAGPRESSLFKRLWPLIFDRPFHNHPFDILFPLNLLYVMGFNPHLRFIRHDNRKNLNIEGALDEVINQIVVSEDITLTPEWMARIREAVNRCAVNGTLAQYWHYSVGMMIWDIEKRTVR